VSTFLHWLIYTHTRVQEPYMGFARISPKIPHLIRRRPNFMFCMQDFESYKWPKKSICTGLRAVVSSPEKRHLAPSFIFFKKIKKECAGHHSSTFRSQIDYNWYRSSTPTFPRLFTGCHAFLPKQRFAKTRPKLEFLPLWTFKVLGSKQTCK